MSGPITKALEEAVELRRQLLDSGMPEAEVNQRIGQSLKAVLGHKRSEPWRFYCEHCRDTGWVNVEPSEQEQARLVRLYGDAQKHAGYVTKCQPCKWTELEREKRRRKAELSDEDDLAAAGQTKKSRGFRRLT